MAIRDRILAAVAQLAALAVIVWSPACAHAKPPVATGTPTAEELAQLWVDPGPEPRNLVDGVGADMPKPEIGGRYEVKQVDASGYSITYRLKDAAGLEWAVKVGPEAQPEVVSSRIVWAL